MGVWGHHHLTFLLLGALFCFETSAVNQCSLPYFISAAYGYDTTSCPATPTTPLSVSQCTLSCTGTGFVGAPAVSCDQDGGQFRLTSTCNKLLFTLVGPVTFPPRIQYGSAIFKGSLYVFGGIHPTTLATYNDVYYTSSGTSWTQLVQSYPTFGVRASMVVAVVDNGMIMVCGRNGNGPVSTVQFTYGGDVWNQVSDGVINPARHGHGALVFNGKLYLFGGYASSVATLNDVLNHRRIALWCNPGESQENGPK